MNNRGWRTIEEKKVYNNPVFSVSENRVIDPNNNEKIRALIEYENDSVVIIATNGNDFYLVGQFRYPNNSYSLEFPNGGVKENEDSLTAGKRELEEELGLESNSWQELGQFEPLNSIMKRKCYIVMAEDVNYTENRQHYPDEYEDLEMVKISSEEFERMINNCEIGDSLTLVAYLKYKLLKGIT